MAPPSILVLGAGELGTAMLDGLIAHPLRKDVNISVLIRPSTNHNLTKQQQLAHLKANNISVVSADIIATSVDELASIFSPFRTVINCFGMSAPPGTQIKLAKAVLTSGCARYFPWQFGVDYDVIGRDSAQDLFTEQLDVRQLLCSQEKMKWVIVSTGIFTSFIFEPAFGIVSEGRDVVTALGGWENKVTATTPRDVGRITAEIALRHAVVEGLVFVAGDTVSMGRIADVVAGVDEGEVTRIEKSVGELEDELRREPSNGMKKYRVVFGKGVGVAWDEDATFNAQQGIKMETVEDWARKNLER